jgi:hypothetical protein
VKFSPKTIDSFSIPNLSLSKRNVFKELGLPVEASFRLYAEQALTATGRPFIYTMYKDAKKLSINSCLSIQKCLFVDTLARKMKVRCPAKSETGL